MSYLDSLAERDAANRQKNIERQKIRDFHISNGDSIPFGYQKSNDLQVSPQTSSWKQDYSDSLNIGNGPLTQWAMDSQQAPKRDNNGQLIPMRPAPVPPGGILAQDDAPRGPVPPENGILTQKDIDADTDKQTEQKKVVPEPILAAPGGPSHTMPDGTQMPGAEHPKTPGLPGYEMSFGEKMGRYGGNIMSAGSKGGMAQVGAMGTTVGEIKNIERDQTRMMREDELAREQLNVKKVPNAAALERQAEIQNMYDTQVKYDRAIQDFIKYGDTVTGPLDSTKQSFQDSQGIGKGDPEREAFRYRIKDIIISDTLLQTAKTSGAISDKEMALFKSGVPKMTDQESVWIAWLTKRSAYLKQINQRISDGVQISATAEIGFTGYASPSPSGQSGTAPSALTQAQTDAMTNNIK